MHRGESITVGNLYNPPSCQKHDAIDMVLINILKHEYDFSSMKRSIILGHFNIDIMQDQPALYRFGINVANKLRTKPLITKPHLQR